MAGRTWSSTCCTRRCRKSPSPTISPHGPTRPAPPGAGGEDQAAGGRVPIVAADFCHEMLERGRHKARQARADQRITFLEADAQRLPLPDDVFQISTVAFGLRNVTDTDKGIAEMARVTQPAADAPAVCVLDTGVTREHPLIAAGLAVVCARLLQPTIPLPVTITANAYAALPLVAVVVGVVASLFGVRRAVRTDPALAFSGA